MHTWRRFLLLLLIGALSLVVPTSSQQQEETLTLYSLKPFSILIRSSSSNENIPFSSIERTLRWVTEKYLKEFFDAAVMHEASPLDQVDSVDLQVSVKRSPERHLRQGDDALLAEMIGSAAFVPQDNAPSRETAEDFLHQLVLQAFGSDYLTLYKERLQNSNEPHLQHVVSVEFMESDGGGDVNSEPPPPPAVDAPQGRSGLQFSLLAVLFVVIVSGMFALFLYVRMTHHAHEKKAAAVHAEEEDHHYRDHPPDLYGRNNLACMAERASHATVVPPQEQQPRSYTTGTSPLQLIYQAAFSRAQQQEQDQPPPPESLMMDAEPVELQDAVDHAIHRSGPYRETEGGTLASWVRSLSAGFQRSQQDPQQQEQQVLFMDGKTHKPFVYRDFPRHDGTPCLIYDSSRDLASTVWATSSPTSSSLSPRSNSWEAAAAEQAPSEQEEPVDSFVDRLEQLMVVRHEQYQERCNMEHERNNRRKSLSSSGGSTRRMTPPEQQVLTVEQAEAALEDFLDIDEGSAAAVVTPTNSEGEIFETPAAANKTTYLGEEHVLTDEKRIDDAMLQRPQQIWDEEDPTITGIMS